MRFPWRILSVCLILLPAVLLASDASVSGVVVNDSTGKPVHMAFVTLSTTGAKPSEASVYTDANGVFEFPAVPPGHYYLYAGEYRYQHAAFGATTPDRYPAILTLGAGEIRQGIELRMRPLGAISGVVLDQDADPLPNVTVQLLVSTWTRGRKTWVQRNGATSNERGEFRLHGILPGRYFLSASTRFAPQVHADVTLGEPAADLIVGTVYYPNATRIQEALPVEVAPGADVHDITLQLSTTPAASVKGHVELPDGVKASGPIQVSFVSHDEAVGQPATFSSMQNEFGLADLAPGHYTAITEVLGTDQYRGMDEVDLQPGPQEVVLHLQKGVPLAGHLEVQGPGAAELAQCKITLIPVGMPQSMRTRLSVPVEADGTFAFPSVAAGVWDIGVQPIPRGGYVKAMKLGDQDVLTTEMNITAATNAPLSVVLSTRGGAVTGTVKVPDDAAADLTGTPRPVVLLAPVGKFSHVASFFMMRPAGEGGKYELRGVTPGTYKVFAFDHLQRNSVQDPDFMARIASLGKPVEVHEGDHINLDLDVLPSAPDAAEPGTEQ